MTDGDRAQFFATCAPGLESVLFAEVRALKLARAEQQKGGVYFEGTLEDAWTANLWLRTAVRVLMRVARFEAADSDALYAGVGTVDWERFLRPDGTLAVDARSTLSALEHTQFVEQRVKDAVVDQFRARYDVRPSVDKGDPELRIHVSLVKDRCRLLVDTSGHSLHRRGWRREQGRAPLAETLAAGVLLLSGWDRRSPLVDPFCGSGTILVEAGLLASNTAPGLFRERFGFERWPGHEPLRWRRAKERARRVAAFPKKLILRGSDASEEALENARDNLAAAGLAEHVELERADAREFAPRRGWNGWIVTNPPYGQRIGGRELTELYGAFGDCLREHCAGYHLALLSGDRDLADQLGFPALERIELKNGGLDCELVVGEL